MSVSYIVFNKNTRVLNPDSLSTELKTTNQFNQNRYDIVLEITDLDYLKNQLLESKLYGKIHPENKDHQVIDFYFGYYEISHQKLLSHSFITTNLDKKPVQLAQRYMLKQMLHSDNLDANGQYQIEYQLQQNVHNQSMLFNDLLYQYHGGIGYISQKIYQKLLNNIDRIKQTTNASQPVVN